MDKAPNFSLVHGVRKPVEIGGSATPSSSTQTEPERVSTAPTSSSANSRTSSWVKSATIQEPFPETQLPRRPSSSETRSPRLPSFSGTRRRRRGRYSTETEDNVSDTLESHRIVVAIDYGTTFTGIAYATPSNETDHHDTSTVQLMMNWGPRMTNDPKIPSVISYSDPNSGERQFGADVSAGAITMINTKLELDAQDTKMEELDLLIHMLDGMKSLNFEHIKASKGMPEYTWKTPEDIIHDYIAKAFDPFWKATDYMAEIRTTAPVDIVITFPVQWSYRARNSTFKAIRRAGFTKSRFPRLRQYVTISEPEAAAIYTSRYIQESGTFGLRQNQCFILCDAGGGTVDVVGYRVKELTPVMELERFTEPTGAKCGSSFINTSFKRWLRRKLGEEYKKLDPRDESDKANASATETGPMRDLMRKFEAHKKAFTQGSQDMRIELPKPLDRLTIAKVVDRGELLITNMQMRSFFDPHVDQIIELIQGHILQIEDRGRMPVALLLIGGFSESKYLQEDLTESIVSIRKMQLHRPETSWSAVVQGAVLYGTELDRRQKTQVMIPCPRHYGIKFSNSYSKKSHDPRDTYTDSLTNQILASDQLTWLIRKGDLLSVDEERVIEEHMSACFLKDSSRTFEVPVFTYSGDEAPKRYCIAHEDVTQVQVLTANFAEYPVEKFAMKYNFQTCVPYYEAPLVCKLIVKGMTITGEMWWYNRCMDKFTISDIDSKTEDEA